jgi:hypothetical protein
MAVFVPFYRFMNRDVPCKVATILLSIVSIVSLGIGLYGIMMSAYNVFTFLTILGVSGILNTILILIMYCIGACLYVRPTPMRV